MGVRVILRFNQEIMMMKKKMVKSPKNINISAGYSSRMEI